MTSQKKYQPHQIVDGKKFRSYLISRGLLRPAGTFRPHWKDVPTLTLLGSAAEKASIARDMEEGPNMTRVMGE
jgi:hypothetical protein